MALSAVGAFHTRLAADSDFSTAASGGIYDGKKGVPQGTALPYSTITRVDTDYDRHIAGNSGTGFARVELDFYADPSSPTAADDMADYARASLDDFSGTITQGSDSLVFAFIHLADESDSLIPVRNAQDVRVPHVRQEYFAAYTLP